MKKSVVLILIFLVLFSQINVINACSPPVTKVMDWVGGVRDFSSGDFTQVTLRTQSKQYVFFNPPNSGSTLEALWDCIYAGDHISVTFYEDCVTHKLVITSYSCTTDPVSP